MITKISSAAGIATVWLLHWAYADFAKNSYVGEEASSLCKSLDEFGVNFDITDPGNDKYKRFQACMSGAGMLILQYNSYNEIQKKQQLSMLKRFTNLFLKPFKFFFGKSLSKIAKKVAEAQGPDKCIGSAKEAQQIAQFWCGNDGRSTATIADKQLAKFYFVCTVGQISVEKPDKSYNQMQQTIFKAVYQAICKTSGAEDKWLNIADTVNHLDEVINFGRKREDVGFLKQVATAKWNNEDGFQSKKESVRKSLLQAAERAGAFIFETDRTSVKLAANEDLKKQFKQAFLWMEGDLKWDTKENAQETMRWMSPTHARRVDVKTAIEKVGGSVSPANKALKSDVTLHEWIIVKAPQPEIQRLVLSCDLAFEVITTGGDSSATQTPFFCVEDVSAYWMERVGMAANEDLKREAIEFFRKAGGSITFAQSSGAIERCAITAPFSIYCEWLEYCVWVRPPQLKYETCECELLKHGYGLQPVSLKWADTMTANSREIVLIEEGKELTLEKISNKDAAKSDTFKAKASIEVIQRRSFDCTWCYLIEDGTKPKANQSYKCASWCSEQAAQGGLN